MKKIQVPLLDNGTLISCLMVSGQGPSHLPFLSIPNTHTLANTAHKVSMGIGMLY